MQNTRRQHYVWQHYLAAWTSDGKLWCLGREDKRFRTGTANVANRRDFYRLSEMTPEDLEIFRAFLRQGDPKVQRLNESWASVFSEVFERRREEMATGPLSPEREKEYETEINNVEEKLLGSTEGRCVRLLNALRAGDVSFLAPSVGVEELQFFGYYLGLQYFRTPRIVEPQAAAFRRILGRDVPLAPFRHMFATNIGWAFAERRTAHSVRLLEAHASAEFITGDQPIYNERSMDGFDAHAMRLEMFYPVSPRFALHVSFDTPAPEDCQKLLLPEEVARHNDFIASISHEQVFAKDPKHLDRAQIARERARQQKAVKETRVRLGLDDRRRRWRWTR